ncbi:hypothetical protein [Micromonospora sp. RTP1Z1]|uniref:hypothetical protein n=1 Tax=Micromonospora sp. RTP1Z1 TaxID=2994043 RepID=UPI0029C60DDF|nr:hypothetical protein [Micromonospora sp. RTP1Z1]
MTRNRTLRAGLVALSLSAASAALLPATPAGAAPAPRPDLKLNLSVTPNTMIGATENLAIVTATVDNVGAATVEDVTVSFTFPPGGQIVGDPAWQCDYTTFVCTNIYGPVPPGGTAEPLRVYVGLPDAPAGTVATIKATAATSAREVTRTNNSGQVQTTYGYVADLSLSSGPQWETDIPADGGPIFPGFTASNVGSAPADDLRLVVDVPAGFTVAGEPQSDPTDPSPWLCDVMATQVVCTAGPLAEGGSSRVTVPMTAPAGTPDDRFAIHGQVSTSGAEWRPWDWDNGADANFHYVAPAV